MKEVLGGEETSSIRLTALFDQHKEFYISLEPFTGHCVFPLRLDVSSDLSFIAFVNPRPEQSQIVYAKSYKELPENIFLLLVRCQEEIFVMMALSHDGLTCTLKGDKEGLFLVANYEASQAASACLPGLIATAGTKLDYLLRKSLSLALFLTGGSGQFREEKAPLPNWIHFSSWSSGLALEHRASHRHILDSVRTLVCQGIPQKFVLIDEGWQDLEEQCLKSFDADKNTFPNGLKGLVEDLKQFGVQEVGVAHPMIGARKGLSQGLIKELQLSSNREGDFLLGEDLGETFHFFYEYYQYLRKQGITFIQVSGQDSLEACLQCGVEITKLYKNIQSAVQAAASLHFKMAPVNVECLHNANLYYWMTPQIVKCVKNMQLEGNGLGYYVRDQLLYSLWIRNFMHLDFGAWYTKTEQSAFIAMFYSLSKGMYSIGDLPGSSDVNLLKKLILPSGERLEPKDSLLISPSSLFKDPIKEHVILKAYAKNAHQGILFLANIAEEKRGLSCSASSLDIEELKGDKFLLWSHMSHYLGVVAKGEKNRIRLKPLQGDIWTYSPINQGVSVLGFPGFFLLSACLENFHLEEESLLIQMRVRAPLMVYSEKKILEVRANGSVVPWEYHLEKSLLSIEESRPLEESSAEYMIYFE